MVSNYRRDAESDKAVGKYNPLNARTWDADSWTTRLSASIQTKSTPGIAGFYTLEEALQGYWQS
jgi:hypothetical protein